jgi:hypothetical protein
MASHKLFDSLRLSISVLAVGMAVCPSLDAQVLLASAPLPSAPTPAVGAAASPLVLTPPRERSEHQFWDQQNRGWFIAAAVSNGADFAVTRANLESGGQELNPVVRLFGRSTPGLAANFVGETVGAISLSYFFHKTGHHKLERAVSVVNMGASLGAVTFGLTHR